MLDKMICVPAARISSGVRPFMAAFVAQKIKAGVWIVPCGVVSSPKRARSLEILWY